MGGVRKKDLFLENICTSVIAYQLGWLYNNTEDINEASDYVVKDAEKKMKLILLSWDLKVNCQSAGRYSS